MAMLISVIVFGLTSLGIIITNIFKPSIKIKNTNLNLYWVIALLGALLILVFGQLSFKEVYRGLTSSDSINPLKILILFISMSLLSIFLDETGLFSFLAYLALKKFNKRQISVFLAFYFLVAVLTMFTSNDIVILTLTPFIIMFCKNSSISPIPYIIGEFVGANTWSMMFIIGNPTNIYLGTSQNISFIEYLSHMWLPTLLTGLTELLILLLIFKKKLASPMVVKDLKQPKLTDKILIVVGSTILIICTLLLVISSFLNIEMYLVCFVSLIVLILSNLTYWVIKKRKPDELIKSFKRAPYELIPFVLGMFIIVLALNKTGFTSKLNSILNNLNKDNLIYGYSSLIGANLLNNIPMSVLYSFVIEESSVVTLSSVYSTIIGSNIGAFLTPIGALAGLMWMSILKKYEVKFSHLDFIKYCCLIGIPVATIAFLTII